MWEPRRLRTLWDFTACYRAGFTFYHQQYTSIAFFKWMVNRQSLLYKLTVTYSCRNPRVLYNLIQFQSDVLFRQVNEWKILRAWALLTSLDVQGKDVISSEIFKNSVLIERKAYFVSTSRDTIVGRGTGYTLDNREVRVRVSVGSRMFSSPGRPDRLWSPPNLLSNGYRGLFPRGWSGRGVKLTTHLQLVPRSRKCGYIHPHPHTPSWRSA
jgi:hypothetical protein